MHYIYEQTSWKRRKRGENKIVPRMYTVSLKDEERFYLRLLLLHVKGARNFEDLRTYNAVIHETFKAAAIDRGLLDSDEEWSRCLTEANMFQMPKQLRETFAIICVFCSPQNPLELWNEFADKMSVDYLRTNSEQEAINYALHDLEAFFKQHGKKCQDFGLPAPEGIPPEINSFNPESEAEEAELLLNMLNENQKDAFLKIAYSIENPGNMHNCFYLDGPGGSGKTFLYRTLMAFYRGKGKTVLPFATTGIAATLLKGGRTVHSGFKLPVPIDETSVSMMRLSSKEARKLCEAAVIIIDEITMLTKHGLECIDRLLKEIMHNDIQFGGKTIVIGGDFRQTLPVVVRGSKADVLESCIKSSRLWRHFTKLSLAINMRSVGESDYNEWLLKVGSGLTDPIEEISNTEIIEIPDEIIERGSIIDSVFGLNIEKLSMEEVAEKVILAPTNLQTLQMNREIINKLPGHPEIYYSADSIMSDNLSDHLNYPTEFLNTQTPSGMPPHVLVLKEGAVVMLLRNLNPQKGLCNGTRLIIKKLQKNVIWAEIMCEAYKGTVVLIPRIALQSDTNLPFVLRRLQFPILPAYAMTINKSQGQTFSYVGIDLQTTVFSHGQLYVALSRCKNPHNIKVRITNNLEQGNILNDQRHFTKNVVYREIFD